MGQTNLYFDKVPDHILLMIIEHLSQWDALTMFEVNESIKSRMNNSIFTNHFLPSRVVKPMTSEEHHSKMDQLIAQREQEDRAARSYLKHHGRFRDYHESDDTIASRWRNENPPPMPEFGSIFDEERRDTNYNIRALPRVPRVNHDIPPPPEQEEYRPVPVRTFYLR